MVEISNELWTLIVTLIVLKLCHWIYQWNNPKCNGKLPPGSMGFPIIGETFTFMKPHDTFRLPTVLTEKVLRHGPIFRTSLFGAKVIVSTDVEVNLEIAKTSRLPGIPKSASRLFADNNIFLHSKESHTLARNLTTQLLGSHGLKLRMMQDIDFLARTHIAEGAKNGGLDIKQTASKILIECLAKKVMGEMEPEAAKELALCWRYFPTEWLQFSWTVPGNDVYRMMKGRKQMMKLLNEMVLKKKASGEEFGEFFKIIFEGIEGREEMMSVEKIIVFIISFFLVANETTPGILAVTVKLISDHPKVMEELQREHDRVVRDRTVNEKEADLTWEDYKSMTFTHMVINESLRVTSTGPNMLRIIDQDVRVGDYTLPAGWIFMAYHSVHFNPEVYEDPFTFNPWRWKDKDLGAILTKSFMPFGAGARLCLGAEFAKFQMAIIIHHLFRYRWSMKTETTILRRVMLIFPGGSHVQISDDTKVDNSGGY